MKAIHFAALTAVALGGILDTYGQTWTLTGAPSNSWYCIASSADSTKLAAGVYQTLGTRAGGPIYISSDSGNSWLLSNAPTNKWSSIASSADGSKLFAVADDGNLASCRVFLSTNSGAAWSTNILGKGISYQVNDFRPQIVCSADGNKLVSSYYGVIWTSANAGSSWSSNSPPIETWESPSWFSTACSADGNKIITIKIPQHLAPGYPYAPNIFISTNAGTTWMQVSNLSDPKIYGDLASSADGSTLAIAVGSGSNPRVFTSTNAGASWATNSLPLYCAGISISADGTKILTAGSGGGWIRSSTNSGSSWMTNNSFSTSMQWAGGVMSADGTRWFLTSQPSSDTNSGQIYSLKVTSAPALKLTPINTNLLLSWLIPSTNFLLQQSSDLANWSDVTNEPVLNLTNLQNQVTLPTSADTAFFRLSTP